MFSGDVETHSLSFQPKSLPSSDESVSAVTSTSIADTVTSSSFEKVVTVSVNDWNSLLEKASIFVVSYSLLPNLNVCWSAFSICTCTKQVNTLEIRLAEQKEYFVKAIEELKSKLAGEVTFRVEMKNEIDKLTELVTQVWVR